MKQIPSFSSLLLLIIWSTASLFAEELKYTISGDAQEKAELETLSPKPEIPTAEEMTFSLDGGKSATESEVVPMSVAEAALKSDLSHLQLPVLPTIPEAPFVVEPAPLKNNPALAHFYPFGKGRKLEEPIMSWDFLIVDERNKELFRQKGEATPPALLSWDGKRDNTLVLKPDETYFPFLVLTSSSGLTARIPGESSRFFVFSTREGEDEIIYFGERLYQKAKPAFSDEARIYLMDVSRRLYQLGLEKQAWHISIYEPTTQESLGEQKRRAWRNFLENTLDRKVADNQVVLYPSTSGRSVTKITLKNFKDPARPIMTGMARDIRPQMEDKKKWVEIKDTGKSLVIEMRNDRLFRSGTAYLKDEAVPLVSEALATVRKEPRGSGRKVVLRSTAQKPRLRGPNQSFEEDPKLSALRTKVLFMIFATDRYLPTNF